VGRFTGQGRSVAVDIDDRLGKGLRGFLG
jgi:hypothetical protein